MKIVLEGSKVVVVGRFRAWKIARLREALAARGATVVTSISSEVDFMISGVGRAFQVEEALNMGVPTLSEDHLPDLLTRGEVMLPSQHTEAPRDGSLFGELRALLHEHECPSAWMWQAVTSLLDVAPREELDAMVAYVKSFTDRWASAGTMAALWGVSAELASPEDDGRALDSSWENGIQGELRVAPSHWVGELYQGVASPKFELVHALDLGSSNLGSAAVEKILQHPQLDNLTHLVTAVGKAPSKKLLATLCTPPLLDQIEYLRLSSAGTKFEPWLVEVGSEPGALRALDVSQYHASLTWECLDAPYLRDIETLGMWGYQFQVFMQKRMKRVTHLILHGVSFKVVARALAEPQFYEPLKTLRVANYHSADWKSFFELDFQGSLDLLDISQPIPYQRDNMLRYNGKALQKLMLHSPLLERVTAIKLGPWRERLDEDAILEVHPHLTILT